MVAAMLVGKVLGKGTQAVAIVVGLALCAGASRADEPVLGPDVDLTGWNLGADRTAFAIDDSHSRDGVRSLRVDAGDGRRSARFSRRLLPAEITGNRLRLRAYVRARDGAEPALWVRVAARSGLIYIDRVAARANPDDDWIELSLDAPLSSSAERIDLGGLVSGRGTAWFDDFSLETLDAATLPEPATIAARYVERTLEILAQYSLRRGELDWPALRQRVRQQNRGARDINDAYLAVRFALGELGDGHSYFMSAAQMRRLDESPVSNARTGRPPVRPRAQRIDPGIGYLSVPGFAGGDQRAQTDFATELQATIASLEADGACGFVIDLRDNRGGNLWPMLVGLGPLLGNGEAGAAVYPDSRRRSFWYRDGKGGLDDFVQLRVHAPHVLERAPTPVAVLTGPATASAAEVLAAAFRAEPSARSFGAATRGAHTGTQVFPLVDGAALVLAVAATSNRQGETFVGPIEPDEAVASTLGRGATASARAATAPTDDAVVAAAVAWLTTREQCRSAESGRMRPTAGSPP